MKKPIYKLSALLLLIIGFIIATSYLFVNMLSVQLLILLVVALLSLIRFKFQKLMAEFKLIIPFVLTMLFVYSILGLLGKNYAPNTISNTDIFKYWIMYGFEKCFLFISTFLFLQVTLSYVSMNDILDLPLHIKYKKYLILGRTLFVHAFNNIGNLEFHLLLVPQYQKKKLNAKQWFSFKIQLTLAVITMILRESKIKGEFIDNRISHCFFDKK